jgi:hypothetical protein
MSKDLPLKRGLSELYPYKTISDEEGYNYYVMQHYTGFVLVVREKIDGTEYLYANGGIDAAVAYANYDSLEYVTIQELLAD